MKHVRLVSRAQTPAIGATTAVEELVTLLLTAYFRHWDNFSGVISNLQKYFAKT